MTMPTDDACWRLARPARTNLQAMTNQPELDPAARIDRLLSEESTVWLSTIRPNGTPHLVPIWFSWDGRRLFVASKPDAVKVRNLRANPHLMLALGEPDEDFDVGLIEAVAELPETPTRELMPEGHLDKYASQMVELGLNSDEYSETYSQPIIIRPTRFLPWHGRTTPLSSVRVDKASSRSLEPIRGWVRRLGINSPLSLGRGATGGLARSMAQN
jgi:PPOX class probable F420-dependent enzyme